MKASTGLSRLGAPQGPHWPLGAQIPPRGRGLPSYLSAPGLRPPPPLSTTAAAGERGVHMCGWVVLQGDFMGVGIKYKWETHEAASPAFTPRRGLPTEEVLSCES